MEFREVHFHLAPCEDSSVYEQVLYTADVQLKYDHCSFPSAVISHGWWLIAHSVSITSSLMLVMLNICWQELNNKWNENKKLAPATSSRWDWAPLRSQSPPTQRSLQTLQVLKILDIFWVCPLPEMRVLSKIVFSSLQYRYIPVGGKITFSTRPLITWIGSGEQDGISAVVNGGCFF